MKTVYWPEEGYEAEEWPLCDGCYADVACEVLIVPGLVYAFGSCRICGEWVPVRELSEASGGGKWGAPTGVCRSCVPES